MRSIIYTQTSLNNGSKYVYFPTFAMVPYTAERITKYGQIELNGNNCVRREFVPTTYSGIYTPDFGIKFDRTDAAEFDYRIMVWQKDVTCQIIDNAVTAFNDASLKKGVFVFLDDYLYGEIKARSLDINPSGIPICTLTIMARNY